MAEAARRAFSRTRGALAVAACALVAHAALYHTLWPAGGAHGYFAWYEPVVAGLSLISLLALAGLVGAGLLGLRGPAVAVLQEALRPSRRPGSRSSESITRLGGMSLGLLLAQESMERSIASGRPTLATFTPAQWLLLVAVLSALASGLVLATRSCETLLRLVFAQGRPFLVREPALAARPRPVAAPRRHNLLSSGGALRAPPPLAV